MWSSAAVDNMLQGSTCCVFRDGILHTLVVTSCYLSYCCLSIFSNQSAYTKYILSWKVVRCVQFVRSEVTLAKFLFKCFETISGKDG